MKIVLYTYLDIQWMVEPFLVLYNKYWGDPITLLSEEDYSNGKLDFIQVPDCWWYESKREIDPQHFSDVLSWFLRQIPEKLVCILMADHFLQGPVDLTRLRQLEEYMEADPKILQCQMGDDEILQGHLQTDVYKDLIIWEGGYFPTALTPAIWNRELMLQTLKGYCNPWKTEHVMKDSFNKNKKRKGWRSITLQPYILSYVNALTKKYRGYVFLTEGQKKEVEKYMQLPIKEVVL